MALRFAIICIAVFMSLFCSILLIDYLFVASSPLPGGIKLVSIYLSDRSSWTIEYSFRASNRYAEFISTAIPITIFIELTIIQLACAFGLYKLGRAIYRRYGKR